MPNRYDSSLFISLFKLFIPHHHAPQNLSSRLPQGIQTPPSLFQLCLFLSHVHPLIYSYIIFVTLIIQTFLRLNNRLCVKYSSVIAKWACLAFIALLENYTSQIVVGSIAICAAEVILLFIIVQGLNTKN